MGIFLPVATAKTPSELICVFVRRQGIQLNAELFEQLSHLLRFAEPYSLVVRSFLNCLHNVFQLKAAPIVEVCQSSG